MKAYRCHKTVHAAKITGVEPVNHETDTVGILTDAGRYELPAKFADKVKIEGEDFGYLVRYADGYHSWSPSKAFEEGYTIVD